MLVGLLALIPIAAYIAARADPISLIAALNVIIVTLSLIVAFRAVQRQNDPDRMVA